MYANDYHSLEDECITCSGEGKEDKEEKREAEEEAV